MDLISAFHFILAVIQPMFALAAVILISRLIRKGLSHRIFRSLLFFFVLMFLLSLWHFADDIFRLEEKIGEIYEFPSYALMIIGFGYVVFTALRSLKPVIAPNKNTQK